MLKSAPKTVRWILINALLFLLILTITRLVFANYFKIEIADKAKILPTYWLGIRYDARVIAIASLLILLLSYIRFFNPFKTKLGIKVCFVLYALFILLLIVFYSADFGYYAYVKQRLNANILEFSKDKTIATTMLWQSYPVLWIIVCWVLVFFIIYYFIRKTYAFVNKQTVSLNKAKPIWHITAFLLLGICIYNSFTKFPLRWSHAYELNNNNASSIALNPFQSFISSRKFSKETFSVAEVKNAYSFTSNYFNIPQPDSNTLTFKRAIVIDSTTKNLNVVLVICESFSAYKSSMWGNPLNTTPFFDSMCKQGVFFDNCFTPAYATARGVWASVTGTPDVQLSAHATRNPKLVNQHTIINDFNGYKKFYFLGGNASWANIRGLLKNNISGLNLYEEGSYKSPAIDVWGISDKNLFFEATDVLAKQTKPFFAIIQTADNHRPYTIPKEDGASFIKKNVSSSELLKYGFESLEEYNAFRYTDFCFQQFMHKAMKQPFFKNTLFVFVGDHGIRGNAGNMFPKAWTEGGLTTLHVPLLFYSPGNLKPQRYSFTSSQTDILPTIAGFAGISYTNNTFGTDLLKLAKDSIKNHLAFVMDHDKRQVGFVNDSIYYNCLLENPNKEELYHIKNNTPVIVNDSTRKLYNKIARGLYETARYMLYHN